MEYIYTYIHNFGNQCVCVHIYIYDHSPFTTVVITLILTVFEILF